MSKETTFDLIETVLPLCLIYLLSVTQHYGYPFFTISNASTQQKVPGHVKSTENSTQQKLPSHVQKTENSTQSNVSLSSQLLDQGMPVAMSDQEASDALNENSELALKQKRLEKERQNYPKALFRLTAEQL